LVWTINYTDSAKQHLRKLDRQTAKAIVDYLDQRIAKLDNPRSSGKALTGPLGGLWRYRIMDYRIICEIREGELCILVLTVGNRKNVYKPK
jgi:mRNA interferase RelE/StbE